ncbi:MAG: sodium:proton antiporter NhaD, partial [Steroidobacteraceae bacterium]
MSAARAARFTALSLTCAASNACAASGAAELTESALGILALVVFVVAYGFVIAEELTELRKSVP